MNYILITGGQPSYSINNKATSLLYENGVRYGSLCMSFYSITCSVYSYLLDFLIKRYNTKSVYITSQLIYSISMFLLAITKTKFSALLISPAAGIMYSSLFTIPYMIVANYHQNKKSSNEEVTFILLF